MQRLAAKETNKFGNTEEGSFLKKKGKRLVEEELEEVCVVYECSDFHFVLQLILFFC